MVQNEVNTLENWRANAEDIQNGIPRLWNRTIYVDQLGGDDANDGSENSPVQTLQRAVDLIPVGGIGEIILLSDYTLESNVNIQNKIVTIDLNKHTLQPAWYEVNGIGRIYTIYLFYAFIHIKMEQFSSSGTPAKILITQSPYSSNLMRGLFTVLRGVAGVFLYIRNQVETDIIEMHPDSSLVRCADYMNMKLNVGIEFFYEGSNIKVYNGSYLIDFQGKTGAIFYLNGGGTFSDENGNSKNLADVIAGVIRDVNDVPRNIVSNIVL